MKTTRYTPDFVESFPTPLAAGVFYVSLEYNTCAHLCACGCGDEAVTPLSPAQWSFTYDGESISVRPSVGNWSLACRSHYVIHKGRVQWARSFSADEISWNRARDRAALDGPNNVDEPGTSGTPPEQGAGNARSRTLRRLIAWIGRHV
jgi:hypothetical protein